MSGANPIRVESRSEGAVRLIVLDNPERRNALGDRLRERLVEAAVGADLDPAVRCVVIAGSARVFASGGDVRALSQLSVLELHEGERARHWAAIRGLRTPLVAAISGFCLGGGLELALCADVAIAAETARFGLPETSLGLIPGAGGTQMLPRLVGRPLAMDMVLSGRLLDAAEAERHGLISRVVGAEEWLAIALTVAQAIAERPAPAQRLAKEAIRCAYESELATGIELERKGLRGRLLLRRRPRGDGRLPRKARPELAPPLSLAARYSRTFSPLSS